MDVFSFSFGLYVLIYFLILNAFTFFKDQEEPEGEVEGENGNSADEASPNTQRDQSPPVTDQIPPLDNSDTVDNESTKLLNEESD